MVPRFIGKAEGITQQRETVVREENGRNEQINHEENEMPFVVQPYALVYPWTVVIEFQYTMIANLAMVRPLWSHLPTLSTLRDRSGGHIQVFGPPDSWTSQNPTLARLLSLHGPEESGADLSWRIFSETGWNRADKVVVRVQIEHDQETYWRRDPRVG